MNIRSLYASLFALPICVCGAYAAGKIGYGSRAGMQGTVIFMSGLDTANAVIRTEHTRDDAVEYCREYVGKVTEGSLRRVLVTWSLRIV